MLYPLSYGRSAGMSVALAGDWTNLRAATEDWPSQATSRFDGQVSQNHANGQFNGHGSPSGGILKVMSEEIGLTRRQALGAMVALCGAGAVAAAGATPAQAASRLKVRLSQFPTLKKVGGVANVGVLAGRQVAVVRTGKKMYVALDRTCPHAGAIVSASGSGWTCPAHGSQFDLDGDRVSGPTPTGLRKLKSRLKRGVLVVSG